MYNQLSEETLSCYPELIKELNSRFRVVEREKTFAAKFSQRTQKPNETVEEYAAELKRLYSKAYKCRDTNTRQQDLVRRFLDGLKDDEARFEIDFHKEPVDIDKAVFHAVNFIQSRRRNATDMYSYQDKKFKKYARRTSQESDAEDSGVEQQEDADSCEYVMRLPSKVETFHGKKPYRSEQKAEHSSTQTESKSITELKDMVKVLTSKVEELQKGSPQPTGYQQKGYTAGGGSRVVCYACGVRGHIARECPGKSGPQGTRSNGIDQPSNRGKVGGKADGKGESLN